MIAIAYSTDVVPGKTGGYASEVSMFNFAWAEAQSGICETGFYTC
jgi:hypothetical protein